MQSAVLGAAARSRMVELSSLCLEGQLEDEGVQSAVFGVAARSRSGGFGCVGSGSSEPNGGVKLRRLCWEQQLRAEVGDLAVLGAAARS